MFGVTWAISEAWEVGGPRLSKFSGAQSLRAARASAVAVGYVNQFELDSVRIGEENRVVARHVVVLPRRVEDLAAVRFDLRCEVLDLIAIFGAKGDLAQADPLPAEGLAS